MRRILALPLGFFASVPLAAYGSQWFRDERLESSCIRMGDVVIGGAFLLKPVTLHRSTFILTGGIVPYIRRLAESRYGERHSVISADWRRRQAPTPHAGERTLTGDTRRRWIS